MASRHQSHRQKLAPIPAAQVAKSLLPRAGTRIRRSYEAEDVNCILKDMIMKEDEQERLEQLKEKDDVIAQLQEQLKSLKSKDSKMVSSAKVAATKAISQITNQTAGLKQRGSDHLTSGGATPTLLSRQLLKSNSMRTTSKSTRVPTSNSSAPLKSIKQSAGADTQDGVDKKAGEDQVRRLTEELAKLQAEYARLRTVLQATNQQMADQAGSTTSPPPFKVLFPVTQVADVNRSDANGHGVNGESDECSEKASFRREILRLKEELLSAQQKMIVHLESKSAAIEELRHLKEDHVMRESDLLRVISDRENEDSKLKLEVADLRKQLGEADDAKRSLRKRLKESEKEAAEMKEFLREEHESLSESFREAEARLAKQAAIEEQLREALKSKEDVCDVLTEAADNAQARVRVLEVELNDTQDGARQLLLKQGEELNACTQVVHQICQLLTVDIVGSATRPTTGLIAAILEADVQSSRDAQLEVEDQTLLSILKSIERAVNAMRGRMNAYVASLETTKMERFVFEADMHTAISRTKDLECEMGSISGDRQRLVDENDRLRTDLHESQLKLQESWRNLGERIDASERAHNLEKELDRERRLLRTVRADNAELESQLKSTVAGNPRLQDEMTLRRQIGSLRQEVFDKLDELDALRTKHDRRCAHLMDNLAKAEAEVRRLDSIIEHVLKCLKSVSNVVENDETLKQLWKDLSSTASPGDRDHVSLAEVDKK